MQVVCVSGIVW